MAGGRLAIIAGAGDLPRLLAEHCAATGRPHLVVGFEDIPLPWAPADTPRVPFERIGRLFRILRRAGCRHVVMAGIIHRPRLRLWRFDLMAWRLAARVLPMIWRGDDQTLRAIAAIFEEEGMVVEGAHEVRADLLLTEGVHTRARPDRQARSDAARAAEIVAALGAADVGQGAVVAHGVCLGLESIQGTDAMLAFVAETAAPFRRGPGGVLYKAPKPGQDRRLDLPVIGPGTVAAAARAGLAGIVVEAGGVMVLDRDATLAAADAAGLFIWARAPERGA